MSAKPTEIDRPDEEYVRDVSEWIYRYLLDRDNGKGAADRMVEEDGDGGKKLRSRAASYDRLTRAYLQASAEGIIR